MRVLITGGAGFIGRWLVKRFLQEGHQVWVLDNLETGSLDNIAAFHKEPDFQRFILGDVAQKETVEDAFQGGMELCLHLAAQTRVQESLRDPEKSLRTNILGTYRILEGAKKAGARVVLVGTCLVYGSAGRRGKIAEDHPLRPASPYAGTKLASEDLALAYGRAYGLPVVVCRPFNTYGPFQKADMEGGVVAIFLRRILAGQPLEIFGDGRQTRDLLYVEDCADFIYKAALAEKALGQVINAGTGRDISIKELARLVGKDRVPLRHLPHPHPQAEIRKLCCDFTRAYTLLGWEPKTSLEEGLARTKEWMSKQ